VKGLEEVLKGMNVNESKKVTLKPSRLSASATRT